MRIFVKISTSLNVDMSLSLTAVVYSCSSRDFETWQICLLTQFAKNKVLTKISGFTVLVLIALSSTEGSCESVQMQSFAKAVIACIHNFWVKIKI